MKKWVKQHKIIVVISLLVLLVVAYLPFHKYVYRSTSPPPVQTFEYTPVYIPREEILASVNRLRSDNGVAPLEISSALNEGAEAKCQDMVSNRYFEHVNPTTGKEGYEYVFDKVGEENAVYASENLAKGLFSSNEDLIDTWLNSPDHKEAMLDGKYTQTGIATCIAFDSDNSVMVVQHFLQPN